MGEAIIGFLLALGGLLGTYVLSALGYALYSDHKRRLLGVLVVVAGVLLGLVGWYQLLVWR